MVNGYFHLARLLELPPASRSARWRGRAVRLRASLPIWDRALAPGDPPEHLDAPFKLAVGHGVGHPEMRGAARAGAPGHDQELLLHRPPDELAVAQAVRALGEEVKRALRLHDLVAILELFVDEVA